MVDRWNMNALLLFLFSSVFLYAYADDFLVGFLPTFSKKQGHALSKYHVGAFMYAIEKINSNPNRLPGHRVTYMYNDTRAEPLTSIQGMTSQYEAKTFAFIGPEQNCETEARVASAWNIPMISYYCRDSNVAYGNEFPTFARTIPSNSKVSKSVISLLREYNWTRFAVVSGNNSMWREATARLKSMASELGIHTSHEMYFRVPYISTSEGPRLHNIIQDTYHQTRVYVFLGDHYALVDFARYLYLANITQTGKYVVIAVQTKPYDRSKNYFEKALRDENVKFARYMVEAFKSFLVIMPRPPCNPEYQKFLDKTLNYSISEPFNAPHLAIFTPPIPIFAAYLYDAVDVVVGALEKVLHEGGNIRNGSLILSKIISHPYNSIQGFEMYIDEHGDVEGNYTVLAVKPDAEAVDTFEMSLQPVGYFRATNHKIPVFELEEEIHWINGKPPVSEPPCGFDGSKCKPSNIVWTIPLVSGVVILFIILVTVVIIRHYLYEQQLARLLWKIDFRDLLIVHDPAGTVTEPQRSGRFVRKLSYVFSNVVFETTPSESKANSLQVGVKSEKDVIIAQYKGNLVAVKMLRKKNIDVTHSLKKQLHFMKEITHDNVNRFIGACIDPPNTCLVTQVCARGSLKDILKNDDLQLDDMFIASLVFDLIKGMIFLHESELGFHGNLKTTNCLVDSRWVLKIGDFGLHQLRSELYSDRDYKSQFWTAPELLRMPLRRGTQKGDVYAFAIILYEINGRHGPWGTTLFKPGEIIHRVRNGHKHPFRPDTSQLTCSDDVITCIKECWAENPDDRPDFRSIRTRLKPLQQGLKPNIFDNMLELMEKHATNLEAIADERTLQLSEEKKKTEALLLSMLPKTVADQLIKGKPVKPEQYECVTIYFSDIVGFTQLSAESTPLEVVTMLNDLYTLFDSIIGAYGVYKVETIGDAYMVVSGLPLKNGINHAGEICSMSLHLLSAIRTFRVRHKPDTMLKLRIGVHSGPVVTGVVGLKMPRYCLFGDTVNTSSRMESTGEPLKIHISAACKALLDSLGGYVLEERGYTTIKGKGEMLTYFLVDENKKTRLERLDNPSITLFDNVSPLLITDTSRLANSLNRINSFQRLDVTIKPLCNEKLINVL